MIVVYLIFFVGIIAYYCKIFFHFKYLRKKGELNGDVAIILGFIRLVAPLFIANTKKDSITLEYDKNRIKYSLYVFWAAFILCIVLTPFLN